MEAILDYYKDISSDWLLRNEGEMLRNDPSEPHPQHSPNTAGIPLVEIEAVAGFGNADFAITEQDVKDYYIVPEFSLLHIDFMLKIRGSSMYPKYNSGDVVACTIIKERNFIQWNRCHIIATASQGILCKRLLPSERKGYIRAVSDNTSYPPFEIPEEDITGIALVVGVVRME
ncbi:MAG: S24 family peptidase [Bacteroidales bacterium]|nr:S24 family peptidase [Bacteroidales bacterium]